MNIQTFKEVEFKITRTRYVIVFFLLIVQIMQFFEIYHLKFINLMSKTYLKSYKSPNQFVFLLLLIALRSYICNYTI